MAVQEVLVPDIGDFTDVPVIEVLVAAGDEVAVDAPLITLESDKATMDVPAPFAGKVVELRVAVGDKVAEGTPIATIEAAGAGSDPASVTADAGPAAAGGPDPTVAGQPGAGSGPAATPTTGPQSPQARGALEGSDPQGSVAAPPTPRSPGSDPRYASPAVRRLARELSVDLATVTGTGRKGRITKEDVHTAKDKPAGAYDGPGGSIPGLNLAPWPEVDFAKYGEVERVPMGRIKRISGPALARNWVMIPHVTHNDEADITDLEGFRKQINSEQTDVKVTMVALLVKAVVGALRQFPEFNSSLDGEDLVIKRYYHVGFAADTPNGLLVPVIRDADRKGLLEIAAELRELSGKAREGKLSAEEMRGGTFSISSLGGIGGTGFTPIVNAPEVAILGVTRSAMRPVWDPEAEEFKPRLILPLSLSYDHRVVDGAAAARFVAHLASELADLRRVLL